MKNAFSAAALHDTSASCSNTQSGIGQLGTGASLSNSPATVSNNCFQRRSVGLSQNEAPVLAERASRLGRSLEFGDISPIHPRPADSTLERDSFVLEELTELAPAAKLPKKRDIENFIRTSMKYGLKAVGAVVPCSSNPVLKLTAQSHHSRRVEAIRRPTLVTVNLGQCTQNK